MDNKKINISVMGLGVVGLVTGLSFAKHGHAVIGVDIDKEKIDKLNRGIPPIYEPQLKELLDESLKGKLIRFTDDSREAIINSRVIFITVGTPSLPTGELDLSYIEKVARDIAEHINEYKVIVEKSTVPVKTGEKLERTIKRYLKKDIAFDVISNPEFLREGSAVYDALHPSRIIIGTTSLRAREIMSELYKDFNSPILYTTVTSAELIKHASNSFLALKISFINAVANICERVGADITEVAYGLGMDPRINPHFLNAGLGYGGSCFPKDVEAFYKLAQEVGYDFTLLKEIQKINQNQKDKFLQKLQEELWIFKDKTIGILGISFKPDTDDIRESPSIYIMKKLLENGAHIKAYDPKAMENAKKVLPNVEYCNTPYEVAHNADALLIITEWEEFKNLDYAKIKQLMRQSVVLDGRNILNPEQIRKLGFIYRSIGRP